MYKSLRRHLFTWNSLFTVNTHKGKQIPRPAPLLSQVRRQPDNLQKQDLCGSSSWVSRKSPLKAVGLPIAPAEKSQFQWLQQWSPWYFPLHWNTAPPLKQGNGIKRLVFYLWTNSMRNVDCKHFGTALAHSGGAYDKLASTAGYTYTTGRHTMPKETGKMAPKDNWGCLWSSQPPRRCSQNKVLGCKGEPSQLTSTAVEEGQDPSIHLGTFLG